MNAIDKLVNLICELPQLANDIRSYLHGIFLWQSIVAFVIGFLGLEMTVRPPVSRRAKNFYRISFVALMIVGCVLAVIGKRIDQHSQEIKEEIGKPHLTFDDRWLSPCPPTKDGFYIAPWDRVSFDFENAGNIGIQHLVVRVTCVDGYEGIDPIDDRSHEWKAEKGYEAIGMSALDRKIYTKVFDFVNPGESCSCSFYLRTNKTWLATNVFQMQLQFSANNIRITNKLYTILPVAFMRTEQILNLTTDVEYRAFLEGKLRDATNWPQTATTTP